MTWPKVPAAVIALVEAIPAWSQVKVFDGRPVMTAPPPLRFTVGYVEDEGGAGDFNQEPGDVDGLREETGAVRCELVAQEGGSSLSAKRAQVADLIDALDAALRADQTLGGLLSQGDSVVLGADFLPVQNTSGASVRVAMSIQYVTRSE